MQQTIHQGALYQSQCCYTSVVCCSVQSTISYLQGRIQGLKSGETNHEQREERGAEDAEEGGVWGGVPPPSPQVLVHSAANFIAVELSVLHT